MISKIKDKEEDLEEIEPVEPPEPAMTIAPISATGLIHIDFNQEMIFPPKIDQSMYESVFEVSITSSLDGSVSKGKFGRAAANDRRQL